MRLPICILAVAAIALAGCQKGARDQFGTQAHGRYVGIGHYTPGPIWAQIAHPDQRKDLAAARLADDDQIIVVMDSNTGAVRQCGNLSGVCVAMDPWSKPISGGQSSPVLLAKHADQLGQPRGGEAPVVRTAPSR